MEHQRKEPGNWLEAQTKATMQKIQQQKPEEPGLNQDTDEISQAEPIRSDSNKQR